MIHRPGRRFLGASCVGFIAGFGLGLMPAAAQTNVALNKPYTWNVAPSYPLSTDAGDATQLTNGLTSSTSGSFHSNVQAVGWLGGSSDVVSVTVDLGAVELIGGMSFGTAGGFSNIGLPAVIDTWVSNDGNTFYYGGELISESVSNAALPDSGALRGQPYSNRHVYRVDDLRLQGRYVKFTTHRAGAYLFADELQVFRGTFAPSEVVQSPINRLGGFENWTRQNKEGAISAIRSLYDLQELGKHSQAAAFSPQIQQLRAQVLAQDRFTTFDPTEGLPYTPLHEQVWQLNGQMNKAAGQADHAIRAAERYEPLHPFDTVTNNVQPLDFHMAGGESRSRAFNLSNNTNQAKTAIVDLLWTGAGPPPIDGIDLRTVRFTEAQEHVIVGSALANAQRLSGSRWQVELPAGATSQLWLDVDSTDLRAGDYNLQMRVTPQGGSAMTMPVNLHVHRGSTGKNSLELFGWDYLSPDNTVQPVSDVNRNAIQGTLKEFGMRSHWIHPGPLAQEVLNSPRSPDGSFAGHPNFSKFKQWLDELESHPEGSDKYYAFLALDLWGETHYSGGIPTSDPRYETAVRSFFQELAEDIDARGLDRSKFVFMPLDEPVGGTGTHAEAVRFTQLMKQAVPEFKAAVTATYNSVSEVDQDLFNEMDVIIANLPRLNTTMANYYKQLTRAEGKSLSTYVATDGGQLRSPANYFRRLGWEAERLGLDAAGVWVAVQSDSANSWDDFSGNGRFELLFAENDSNRVEPSKMLAAMKEGAQDYGYFKTIRNESDDARDIGITRGLGWWAKRAAKSELTAVFGSLPSVNDTTWKRNASVNNTFDRVGLLNTIDVINRFAPKAHEHLADDFDDGAALNLSRWSRLQPKSGGAQNVTDVDSSLGVLKTRRGELTISQDSFDLHAGELTLTAKMLSQSAGDGHVARIYNADRSQYLEMVYNDQGASNDRVRLRTVGAGGVVQSTLLDTTIAHNLNLDPQWMAMNIDNRRVELSYVPHKQRTFSDFEGVQYASGQSVHGKAGWQVISGWSVVTPDAASGYTGDYTLQGDRSLALNGQASRSFDSGTTLADGTIISWRMSLDPGASAAVYFSDNLAAGSTPGGVQLSGGNVSAFANSASGSATGLIYEDRTEYVVSLQLNFTTDRFSLWIETPDGDLLDASSSTYRFTKLLSAADLLDDGGIFLTSTGATIFDDIQITSPLSGSSPAVTVFSGLHGLGGDLSGIWIALGNELTSAGSEAAWDNIRVSQADDISPGATLGDADLDGDVDLADLSALAANYGQSSGMFWQSGDFDLDGDVDLADLSSLAAHYGNGSAEAFAAFSAMVVPEPSAMVLFLAAGVAYSSRRFHRRSTL